MGNEVCSLNQGIVASQSRLGSAVYQLGVAPVILFATYHNRYGPSGQRRGSEYSAMPYLLGWCIHGGIHLVAFLVQEHRQKGTVPCIRPLEIEESAQLMSKLVLKFDKVV